MFVTSNGTSFYQQCYPAGTVDLAFSATAMHWFAVHAPAAFPAQAHPLFPQPGSPRSRATCPTRCTTPSARTRTPRPRTPSRQRLTGSAFCSSAPRRCAPAPAPSSSTSPWTRTGTTWATPTSSRACGPTWTASGRPWGRRAASPRRCAPPTVAHTTAPPLSPPLCAGGDGRLVHQLLPHPGGVPRALRRRVLCRCASPQLGLQPRRCLTPSRAMTPSPLSAQGWAQAGDAGDQDRALPLPRAVARRGWRRQRTRQGATPSAAPRPTLRNGDLISRPPPTVQRFIPTTRTWSNSTYLSALGDHRSAEEKEAIVDEFFGRYEAEVAADPDNHAMDCALSPPPGSPRHRSHSSPAQSSTGTSCSRRSNFPWRRVRAPRSLFPPCSHCADTADGLHPASAR